MSSNLDFTPFHCIGDDGRLYTGVRPVLVPAPIRRIRVVLGGQTYLPTLPENEAHKVVFYRGAINCTTELRGWQATEQKYRMIAVLNDGRKWATTVDQQGVVTCGWI